MTKLASKVTLQKMFKFYPSASLANISPERPPRKKVALAFFSPHELALPLNLTKSRHMGVLAWLLWRQGRNKRKFRVLGFRLQKG